MPEFDWFDGLPSDAQRHVTELMAVVKELASRGPFFSGEYSLTCVFCGYTNYENSGGVEYLEGHEPSCIWRRAKALQEVP